MYDVENIMKDYKRRNKTENSFKKYKRKPMNKKREKGKQKRLRNAKKKEINLEFLPKFLSEKDIIMHLME